MVMQQPLTGFALFGLIFFFLFRFFKRNLFYFIIIVSLALFNRFFVDNNFRFSVWVTVFDFILSNIKFLLSFNLNLRFTLEFLISVSFSSGLIVLVVEFRIIRNNVTIIHSEFLAVNLLRVSRQIQLAVLLKPVLLTSLFVQQQHSLTMSNILTQNLSSVQINPQRHALIPNRILIQYFSKTNNSWAKIHCDLVNDGPR
jgi:hypothetical protein